jgi:hypothetical protein
MRQCKDDVKVAGWKQLLFAGFNPSFSGYLLAFRAMPVAAGMIGYALGAAVTAAFDVATQISSTAVEQAGYQVCQEILTLRNVSLPLGSALS